MRNLFLALATITLLAAATPPHPKCSDDKDNDRCQPAALAKQRALYEAEEIEQLAKRKVQVTSVRRRWLWSGRRPYNIPAPVRC